MAMNECLPAQWKVIQIFRAAAEMLLSMISATASGKEYPSPRRASIMAAAGGGTGMPSSSSGDGSVMTNFRLPHSRLLPSRAACKSDGYTRLRRARTLRGETAACPIGVDSQGSVLPDLTSQT